MIFNSITRELNQQDHFRRRQYQQKTHQSSYFPQRTIAQSNIFQKIPETTYPRQTTQSNLAKMNSKISENIEYLRYKDQLRTNQLRSSRVSCSSNRSHRSNHSNKSLKSYQQVPSGYIPGKSERNTQVRSYLPSEQSKIKTIAQPQYYHNEEQSSKTRHNYWKQQNRNNNVQKNLSRDQFKYFTRKPVTIDMNYIPSESKQAERDVNQSHHRSAQSNKSESLYDFPHSQPSRLNTLQAEPPKHASGIEWNASFGSSMRNSKLTPINEQSTNVPPVQQANKVEISKPPVTEALSPLDKIPLQSKKSKNGLIISAGLIALGVLILLLQILK